MLLLSLLTACGGSDAPADLPIGLLAAGAAVETEPAPVEEATVLMRLEMEASEFTQEAIVAGEHHMISGEIEGTCPGVVWLQVIPDPSSFEGIKVEELHDGPVTQFTRQGVGAFAVAVPAGLEVKLGCFCDADSNNEIGGDDDAAGNQTNLGKVTEDRSGILIAVEGGPMGPE